VDCGEQFKPVIIGQRAAGNPTEPAAMRIREELERRRALVGQTFPPGDLKVVEETIERLRAAQIAEQSLRVGETLPDFALPDPSGALVTSDELLDRGPLVLAFFRGGWCPYCPVALEGLESVRAEIEAAGASLVGVSPVRGPELQRVAEERKLGFRLLSDVDGRFSSLCGVRYEISEQHIAFYHRVGVDLASLHDGAGWTLPLPATYVVGQDGVIRYVFVDPDWAYRAEPEELVAAVRAYGQELGATDGG
jgi:peroxiredoxin